MMLHAYEAVRKAIESTYRGMMTIYEYRSVTDSQTYGTWQKEAPVLSRVPCKLSFETITSTAEGDNAASREQRAKVFVPPETVLKPGCKLVIEQDGVTTAYAAAGQPAVYPTHKEYMLEIFEEWA